MFLSFYVLARDCYFEFQNYDIESHKYDMLLTIIAFLSHESDFETKIMTVSHNTDFKTRYD